MTEGEAWTREVVAELRASRYRPRAWRLFVARSLERARLARRERRRAHRQTLALAALGVVAWLVVVPLGSPWLALAGATWWALIVAMLDWHLGMLEDAAGRRSAGLGVPNLLTLLRVAPVPALVVLSPTPLLVVLVAGGIADVLDGAVARAFGQETRLGAWLDGGVDGFVLGAAAVGAGLHGLLPWWTVALLLARHAVQWTVVATAWLTIAELPTQRRAVSGKTPGAVLFAGLVLACLRLPGATALVAAGSLGGLATFGLTLVRAHREPAPVHSEHASSRASRSGARRRGDRIPAARPGRSDARCGPRPLAPAARPAELAHRSAAGDRLRRDRSAVPGPDAAGAPAQAGRLGARHGPGPGRAPHAGA